MAIDYEAEGLLQGLEEERERTARLELLRRLTSEGFSLEELKGAVAEGRLALLPVERVLEGQGARYTPQEVAELSELERDFLDAVWRALGLALTDPDAKVLGEGDLEAARRVKTFRDAGLPDEGILEITRVMSQGMRNVAAAAGRVFAEAFMEPGDSERDLALRWADAARALIPELGAVLEHVLRLQQRENARRAVIGSADLAAGELPGAQEVAVCFADLVGFTDLGESVPPEELGSVARRLGELAAERAEPPVTLVKTIGDAAMLVSPEPEPLLDAALDLVGAARDAGEDFPELRAGLALGDALQRSGDWYGRPVNLASRLTSFARPRSVVAASEVRRAAGDRYSWSWAGKRRFKGVRGEVSVYRVRRTSD